MTMTRTPDSSLLEVRMNLADDASGSSENTPLPYVSVHAERHTHPVVPYAHTVFSLLFSLSLAAVAHSAIKDSARDVSSQFLERTRPGNK
jgi:hypothetical protein